MKIGLRNVLLYFPESIANLDWTNSIRLEQTFPSPWRAISNHPKLKQSGNRPECVIASQTCSHETTTRIEHAVTPPISILTQILM
jgi:hypothetical protein